MEGSIALALYLDLELLQALLEEAGVRGEGRRAHLCEQRSQVSPRPQPKHGTRTWPSGRPPASGCRPPPTAPDSPTAPLQPFSLKFSISAENKAPIPLSLWEVWALLESSRYV